MSDLPCWCDTSRENGSDLCPQHAPGVITRLRAERAQPAGGAEALRSAAMQTSHAIRMREFGGTGGFKYADLLDEALVALTSAPQPQPPDATLRSETEALLAYAKPAEHELTPLSQQLLGLLRRWLAAPAAQPQDGGHAKLLDAAKEVVRAGPCRCGYAGHYAHCSVEALEGVLGEFYPGGER
jgi:hypothetical protein